MSTPDTHISIEPGARPEQYTVTVSDADGSVSRHVVDVPADYVAKLGVAESDDAAVEDLLRRSFRFLLAREPKESILASFTLSDIERYFPDYVTELSTP